MFFTNGDLVVVCYTAKDDKHMNKQPKDLHCLQSQWFDSQSCYMYYAIQLRFCSIGLYSLIQYEGTALLSNTVGLMDEGEKNMMDS